MTSSIPVPVHQRVAQQARRDGQALALIAQDQQLTYEALDVQSDAVAQALIARGIRPGDLVGVCLARTAPLVVTLLGILKSGAAYVPLDPGHPVARLAGILAVAQPPLVLTQAALRDLLPAGTPCVTLDELSETVPRIGDAPNAHSTDDLTQELTENALSYVMFTSGSTGKPKGVQVRHAALSNLMEGMQTLLQLRSDDRLLALAPVSFDISVLELFLPLCHGACVVLATREQAVDAPALARLMQEAGITVCQATPSTWRMLRTVPALEQAREPVLRQALCGGEAWGRDLGDFLGRIARQVWNVYGPTETTIWSTALELTPQGDVHLGQPILNTTLHVLDEQLQPLPVGEPGELFIGGAGLAAGYLGQGELTAEKFIANPFGDGRLYRTGDLVRRRKDGGLDFLGRLDFQVKLRGHRIELSEIEETLTQHPAVHHAVVTAHDDGLGHPRLAAYYQLKPGAQTQASELRAHLAASLPLYMVPSTFDALAAFPLNANGKVDIRQLPEPTRFVAEEDRYLAPRSIPEAILSQMWSGILGVERVGVHDNFFDLGGDSFSATELMVLIQQRFALALPLAVMLSHPTVAELAQLLGQPQYDVAPRRSVRLNTAIDSGMQLFCVPPIGGVATVFAPLARALSGQVELHGLQVSGLRYAPGDVPAMRQLVTAYANEIERLRPRGPVHLMGYSAGGAITHALIDTLLAAGRDVGRVFLLNPYGRPPRKATGYDHTSSFWNVWRDLLGDAFDLRGPPAEPLMALSRSMWPDPHGKVDGKADFAWPRHRPDAAAALPRNVTPEVYELLIQGVHTTWLAYRQYDVSPLKHTPTFRHAWLVQPDANSEEYRRQRAEAWSGHMRCELSRHEVPGEHAKLLRHPRSVAAIARVVRQACQAGDGQVSATSGSA